MNKKGITLTALIISIVVLCILIGTTVYFGDKVLNSINDAKYITEITEIKEALEMYKTKCLTKDKTYDAEYLEWEGTGSPSNTGKITDGINEDTIQTILSTEDIPSGIKIESGKIVSSSALSDERISLLESIQVYLEAQRNLLTYQNHEVTINGVHVIIEDDGYITLDGTPTQNCFIKLSGTYKTATSSNGLLVAGEKVASVGEKLKLKLTPVSGSITGHNGTVVSETEFNVILRSTAFTGNIGGVATAYKIPVLRIPMPDSPISYPEDGSYAIADKDIACVYIFTKGSTLSYNNYRFKVELLEKVEREQTEYATNDFNLPVGRVLEGGGITIDVTEDYNIIINGKTTQTRNYIALLPDKKTPPLESRSIISTSSADLAGRIRLCKTEDNLNPLISNETNIIFQVEEVSGTYSGNGTSSSINVLLRNYESATVSNVSKYGSSDSTQFNLKILAPGQQHPANISMANTVTNGDVYTLGLYLTGGLTFVDYTLKPSMTVIQ